MRILAQIHHGHQDDDQPSGEIPPDTTRQAWDDILRKDGIVVRAVA